MNENQIKEIARSFLKENYDMDLSIPVKIDGRMKRTMGVFRYIQIRKTGENKSLELKFSKDLTKYHSKEDIISTIKHECIHYALFEKGLPYRDGHPYFENELKKHNSHSTQTIEGKGERWKYTCKNDNCDMLVYKIRRLKIHRYACKCGAGLVEHGKVLVK